MTTETATASKSPANAAPAAKHGCCGGEAAPESRNDASDRADHEHHAHHEHAAPSKAAQSSCCCGTAQETSPADQKSRSAAPK